MSRFLLVFGFLLYLSPDITEAKLSGEEIVDRVREAGDMDSAFMLQSIVTCRYRVDSGSIKCIERPERKEFYSVFKDHAQSDEVNSEFQSKSIVILTKPVSEKGISFLQYDYRAKDRDSDQWIYIPAFSRIKRVVSTQSSSSEGGLFGSEIEVSDMRSSQNEKYSYQLAGEEVIDGVNCWVINITNDSKRYLRGKYSSIQIFVSQEEFLVLKEKLFDKRNNLLKQILRRDFVKERSVRIAATTIVDNVQKKRITFLKNKRLAIDVDVDEELVSKRTMEDEAYRERQILNLSNTLTQK